MKEGQLVGNIVEVITAFNIRHHIENPPTMWNISYLANAISEESGEIAGAIKKMLRDGISEELKQNLFEEIVDVHIYLAMLIEVTGMDFDAEYYKKEEVLEKRFTKYQDRGFSVAENMKKVWE